MPKKPRRKESDYLQFRPYHAFTSPAAAPGNGTWKAALWWAVLLGGAVMLLAAGVLWLSLR